MNINVNAVIGIDPGKNGGIAVYTKADDYVKIIKMPETTEDLADFLRYYRENYKPIAFLEKLNIHRDDMKEGGKIFGIGKLMENHAQLKTTLEVVGIPFCQVHPMSWEHKLGLRQKGRRESKTERKNRYKEVAARIYPANKVVLWNADALLIMHFGRVMLANDPAWVRANLPTKTQDLIFGAKEAL